LSHLRFHVSSHLAKSEDVFGAGLPNGFFKPKSSIQVNFEVLWNGECWYIFGCRILLPFGFLYGHLVI
jgi:hypothetical protein